MSTNEKTACIIIIGNEILSGRTLDKNTQWLASNLTELGINVRQVLVVPDVKETIISAVQSSRAAYDYVFTTGGIGPTHDDITSDAIGAAFGAEVELNPVAHAILKQHYKEDLNEARLKMAHIPKGAQLIENPVSAAPGFRLQNVYVLAGIPSIMQAMFKGIKHELVGGPPTLSRTVCGETSEGIIATKLSEIQQQHPMVDIGSYPFFKDGKLGVNVVIRGLTALQINAAAQEVSDLLGSVGKIYTDSAFGESS